MVNISAVLEMWKFRHEVDRLALFSPKYGNFPTEGCEGLAWRGEQGAERKK